MRKSRKRTDARKRFYADCSRCTASFDADRIDDTQKRCGCGELLTWNDREEMRSGTWGRR